MSTTPLLALVKKDVRLFLKDRRAVILSFAVPVMLASLFSLIGGGGGGDGSTSSAIPLLVVDEDQSAMSREVVKGLSEDKSIDVEQTSRDEAQSLVRSGKKGVAIVIPKGFGDKATSALFRGVDKPEITFLQDPTHRAEAGMARGLLMQHVMQAVSKDAFGGPGGSKSLEDAMKWVDQENDNDVPPALRTAMRSMFKEVLKFNKLAATEKAVGDATKKNANSVVGFSAPFEVRDEVVAAAGQAPQGMMAAHSFAGMAVQFILFGSVEAGIALLLERQRGLWRRLRAAPISRMTLLLAKAIAQSMIGLLITLVVFAFGMAVFQVRFSGSFVGFVLVSTAYCLTASAFGLLIAALGKTPEAARGISIMAVLLMVFLGGAWMPSFMFPPWMQTVTLAIPTRWAVDGMEGATWRGLSLIELLPATGMLLLFAAIFGALAVARFRWEED
jgi:ABC-2 type transport system permease protein